MLVALLLAAAASAPPALQEANALSVLSGARSVDEEGVPETATTVGCLNDELPSEWAPRMEASHVGVYQLAEPWDLTRLEALNSADEESYPGLSVKKLRVEAAPARHGPWTKAAEVELKKGGKPQPFPASAKAVRWLRVTLLSNHGNADWLGIRELRVLGRRSTARNVDFTGAWDTAYGEIKLAQTGQRITGCYGEPGKKSGNYTVQGTLEGSVFFGSYREMINAQTGEAQTGIMTFALTAEGDLAGVRGTDPAGADRTGRWDGTRKPEPTITCEKPESDLDKQLRSGRVVLRGILFDTGKDMLRPESVPVLEALAAAMKKGGEERYLVEGHTDDRGGREPNQALSERRAASVAGRARRRGGAPADRGLRPDAPRHAQRQRGRPRGEPAGRGVDRAVAGPSTERPPGLGTNAPPRPPRGGPGRARRARDIARYGAAQVRLASTVTL